MKKSLSILLALILMATMFACVSCGNDEPEEMEAINVTPEKVTETLLDKGGYEISVSRVQKMDKDYMIYLDAKNKNKVGATINLVDVTVDGKEVAAEVDADALAKETTTVGILIKTSELKNFKKMGELKGTLQVQEQEDWEVEYEVPVTFDAWVFSLL